MGRPSNDEKIINENPGLSPEDLLAKGLSQKRFVEMAKEIKPEVKEQHKKIIPEIQPSVAAKTREFIHVYHSDQVVVKMPDGSEHPFTLKAAQKLVRKNPKARIL